VIAQDFAYLQPDTKEEAVELFQEYANPLYYGGGSEIITMCRAGDLRPAAVIDLKGIPEAGRLGLCGDALVIGGCVSLRQIKDSRLFPLLSAICGRIADHTNQCRITLGGNLCGAIRYRETALALLLTDADIVLFGLDGMGRFGRRCGGCWGRRRGFAPDPAKGLRPLDPRLLGRDGGAPFATRRLNDETLFDPVLGRYLGCV